jgi:hypothetical protein
VSTTYAVNSRLIWKFELHPYEPWVEMPKGATVLSAGAQGDEIVVWAHCNPNAPKVERWIGAFPTGGMLPSETAFAAFLATVQMSDGLVFHVYVGAER